MKFPKVDKSWQDDLQKLRVAEVTWVDATVVGGWWSADRTDHSNIEVKSVGWYLPPTKTQIRLGYSITSNGMLNELFLIPKAWVKKVRLLK